MCRFHGHHESGLAERPFGTSTSAYERWENFKPHIELAARSADSVS